MTKEAADVESGGSGRLPRPNRDELDDDAAAVYDKILGSRSASGRAAVVDADGRLLGPFNAMLASPAAGDALQHLGAAIRYRSSLPDRVRELAILTVAARRRSEFEWYAHEPLARAAGLGTSDLAALRGDAMGVPNATDQLIRRGVESLLQQRDLDDETYGVLRASLGEAGVVELVTLVGYYDLLALSMSVFRVPPPGG